MQMLLITIAVSMAVVSQLMLRYAMMNFGEFDIFKISCLFRAFSNPWVIGGILLYGFGSVLWLKVLTKAELSYAYPIGSLGFILIAIFGWIIFKEDITPLRLIGILLICIGVFFVAKS